MANEINTVNHERRGRGHHHGDLRAALLAAATEIVEESGPDTFSLRAAARRAGVSPAAPAHHFGDVRGLLTAVATDGFVELADRLEAAAGAPDGAEARRLCHAYLDFGQTRPGLFRLMWRKSILDTADPAHFEAARRAYLILDGAIRGTAAASAPFDPLAAAPTLALWSAIHGFVSMVIEDAFFARPRADGVSVSGLLDAILDEVHPARERSAG